MAYGRVDTAVVRKALTKTLEAAAFSQSASGLWRCRDVDRITAPLHLSIPHACADLVRAWLDGYRARIEADVEIFPMILGHSRVEITARAILRRMPAEDRRNEQARTFARWFEEQHMNWLLTAMLCLDQRGVRVLGCPEWGEQ